MNNKLDNLGNDDSKELREGTNITLEHQHNQNLNQTNYVSKVENNGSTAEELNTKIDEFTHPIFNENPSNLYELDHLVVSSKERYVFKKIRQIKQFKEQQGITNNQVSREIFKLFKIHLSNNIIVKLDSCDLNYRYFFQKIVYYMRWYENRVKKIQT
ncbi:unnamed protein product [Brachionus calyciflorus]|uniref:Uncharacterized protein n=1 Tax=Brachionus calyciflorus TaxID=104777 RepID=A0A814B4D6_9BILA|nr:unnamed protein product [Brachionus calyciflorus]